LSGGATFRDRPIGQKSGKGGLFLGKRNLFSEEGGEKKKKKKKKGKGEGDQRKPKEGPYYLDVGGPGRGFTFITGPPPLLREILLQAEERLCVDLKKEVFRRRRGRGGGPRRKGEPNSKKGGGKEESYPKDNGRGEGIQKRELDSCRTTNS